MPVDEAARLRALRSLNILDTPAEQRFDRIVRMARRMFDVPVAFISFIDANRQWFKSSIGIDIAEIAREQSICAHTILGDGILLLDDAAADSRFADGPLVVGETRARFYASCPLTLANGIRVGTLCVADRHPRSFRDEDLDLLRDLVATVERELRITNLAITDELTGIYNRQGFILAAHHSLNLCVRQDLPATLAYIDLSELRLDAENYDEPVDEAQVLTEIASILKSECRPSDIFARHGVDEFAALFINAPRDSVEGIMDRFHQLLSKPDGADSGISGANFTYGIVEYDFKRHKQIETLLDDGAAALHGRSQRKAS